MNLDTGTLTLKNFPLPPIKCYSTQRGAIQDNINGLVLQSLSTSETRGSSTGVEQVPVYRFLFLEQTHLI